jgi:Flp pilus assembly protein TadG
MRRFARDDRGAAAIEYAFVLPALLGLAIGVMDLGRLVWTQVTLDRAVQAAARCAAVNATTCGSDANIKANASQGAWGMTVAASKFTVSRPACGVQVEAQVTFQYTVPWPAAPATVRSAACYPTA